VTQQHVLSPEDDLFGRVALFNNFVSLEEVVECARIIAAETVAGREKRSLASVLIRQGHISAAKAGAIEAALRRKAGETGRAAVAPSGATPKRKPMKEKAPAGHSQITVALDEDGTAASGEASAIDDETLKKIVKRLAPGRVFPEMLDHIMRHKMSAIDVGALAAGIDEPKKQVMRAIRHWQKIGLVRRAAGYPLNFLPSRDMSRKIEQFLEAWHDGQRHARVLGFILECE
jgi:hypothetical protein